MQTASIAEISTSRRRGSVLMVVLCLSALLLFAALAMGYMTSQSVAMVRRLQHGAQTLAIAEAGIADMIARLSTNYNQWKNTNCTASFGNGAYTVVSQVLSNNNVLLTSAGMLNGVVRTTIVELLGTYQDINDERFSLEGVILAGGDVRFSTAAFNINGNVHANGNVTSANGAQNGDFTNTAVISAVGSVGDLDAGTIQPGAPARILPTFNLDSYRELAISNGIYYSNSVTLANWHGNPSNGIVYVNGDVTVQNQSSLHGTLVANGNISIQNNFTHTQFSSNMPALISAGSITLNNKETYQGVIYAALNVIVQNNVTCNGGIISGGYTEIQNKSTMNQPTGYPPWDPLNPTVPPEVLIGGWLR